VLGNHRPVPAAADGHAQLGWIGHRIG